MALFTALIAVGAFVAIPLGPVPFTLQVLFVLLAGLVLGPRLGALSVAAYLVAGARRASLCRRHIRPRRALRAHGGLPVGLRARRLRGRNGRPSRDAQSLAAVMGGLPGLLPVYALGAIWLASACTPTWAGACRRRASVPAARHHQGHRGRLLAPALINPPLGLPAPSEATEVGKGLPPQAQVEASALELLHEVRRTAVPVGQALVAQDAGQGLDVARLKSAPEPALSSLSASKELHAARYGRSDVIAW